MTRGQRLRVPGTTDSPLRVELIHQEPYIKHLENMAPTTQLIADCYLEYLWHPLSSPLNLPLDLPCELLLTVEQLEVRRINGFLIRNGEDPTPALARCNLSRDFDLSH